MNRHKEKEVANLLGAYTLDFIDTIIFILMLFAIIWAGMITSKKDSFKQFTQKPSPTDYRQETRERGEQQVAYQLGWLDKNQYRVLSNLDLFTDSYDKQEFGHIVIGPNGIFNIETKNYSGRIIIDDKGNWRRIKNSAVGEEGLENPWSQAYRHRKVLEAVIGSSYPIIDLVVLAHPDSIIEGADNSLVKVVKYDALLHRIENHSVENKLTPEQVESIECLILDHAQGKEKQTLIKQQPIESIPFPTSGIARSKEI